MTQRLDGQPAQDLVVESPVSPVDVARVAARVITETAQANPDAKGEIASVVSDEFGQADLPIHVPSQNDVPDEERLDRREAVLLERRRRGASPLARKHAADVLQKLNLLDT